MNNGNTNLEILVQLKDEASASFKKVADNISSDSFRLKSNFAGLSTDVSGLSKALLGGALAAGGIAVAFGVSAVKAFTDAQVAMARVHSTIDATIESMKAADLNKLQKEANKAVRDGADIFEYATRRIEEMAEATVKLGFDDEDAAEAAAKLYQRTGDLTKAQTLLNISMDLARAKNMDLQSAANLVNMVLSGQGRILAQYGIQLKETATPMEALLQLQKMVSGQANAFSQTFQGQMQVLSVEFGNIKESIGQVLVEALLPFIQQFSAWLSDPETKKNFQHWTAEFKSWAEVIIPVIIDTFKMWFDWANKLFGVLTSIGNTIVSIVNSMNALGQNGTGGLQGFINAWKNAGSNIMWAAQGAIPGRAAGGPVTGGNMYMVGERGPELFVPATSGSIIPNPALAGSGPSISISIGSLYGTDEDAANRFADRIVRTVNQQLKLKMY